MDNNRFSTAWAKCNALYSSAAAILNVGYPELMVLYALETMGRQTQMQIAENFGMQKQTVHTVVSALGRKGYLLLEPSRKDKREKLIILTDSGREYARKIIQPLIRAEESVCSAIGREKMQAMCESMELFNLLFELKLSGGLENE